MMFTIKMEGLCRKARLVAGGNMTEAPTEVNYDSVVLCEAVRIALLIAALYAIEIKTRDVQNVYITEPVK